MAQNAAIHHSGFDLLTTIRSAFSSFLTARARAVEFNRSYAELQSLSDRELNDIGVRRCDIADRVRHHVYCD